MGWAHETWGSLVRAGGTASALEEPQARAVGNQVGTMVYFALKEIE